MPYRLLHLADVHLERSFAGLGCHGELARRRRIGLREALRAAGEAAQQHGCSAVSIAGDLYEHERAGVDTERFLVETFASWRPLRVLISPGNHDAFMPGSLYRRAAWPDNVHVFSESQLQPVTLDDGLVLWGLAHREPAWTGDPLDCDALPPDDVHVALFHGADLGSRPEGKSLHGPFHADAIRARGFVAALCGHYHRRRLDTDMGLVYPGSPEPLTFDETGPRGPVLVDIDNNSAIRFTSLHLNRWWMVSAVCDVSECVSTAAVVDMMELAARTAVANIDPERTMLRIDMSGDVDCAVPLDVYNLEAALRERGVPHVKVRDLSAPRVDLRELAGEQSTRGAFVRTARAALESAQEEHERATVSEALRYGLMALAGTEIGLR
jgi:hypothetical protein